MFGSHCRKEIAKDAKLCHFCGVAVNGTAIRKEQETAGAKVTSV